MHPGGPSSLEHVYIYTPLQFFHLHSSLVLHHHNKVKFNTICNYTSNNLVDLLITDTLLDGGLDLDSGLGNISRPMEE
jgi:hypothetical protein